jgi:hypothetical protein
MVDFAGSARNSGSSATGTGGMPAPPGSSAIVTSRFLMH